MPLTEADDTAPRPLPWTDVDPVETEPTPPVDQPAGTVQGYKHADGERYCVYVTPEAGAPVGQCVDVGPAIAVAAPFGPVELVHVGSSNPPDTPPVGRGSVYTVPSQHVPAYTVDLLVETSWVASRFNNRVGDGLVTLYDPVDLDDADELEWWADNGAVTSARTASS